MKAQKSTRKCQGDVLIIPAEIPKDVIKINTNVLQEGEHTGHAHRLYDGEYEVFETSKKQKYLRIIKPTQLRHEEHKAFIIDPGVYKIGIVKQWDYDEQEQRNVID